MKNLQITKHSQSCKMAFGRKDPTCARCVELMNGATARAGWQAVYYTNKAREEKMDALARAEHKATCVICVGQVVGVCTFGEF